jgi:hypothetical protein
MSGRNEGDTVTQEPNPFDREMTWQERLLFETDHKFIRDCYLYLPDIPEDERATRLAELDRTWQQFCDTQYGGMDWRAKPKTAWTTDQN